MVADINIRGLSQIVVDELSVGFDSMVKYPIAVMPSQRFEASSIVRLRGGDRKY